MDGWTNNAKGQTHVIVQKVDNKVPIHGYTIKQSFTGRSALLCTNKVQLTKTAFTIRMRAIGVMHKMVTSCLEHEVTQLSNDESTQLSAFQNVIPLRNN